MNARRAAWAATVLAASALASCAPGQKSSAAREPPAVATLGVEPAAPAARFKDPIRTILLIRCTAGDAAKPAAVGAVRARLQGELATLFSRPAPGVSEPARSVRMARPASPNLIVLDLPWGERATFHVDLPVAVEPAPEDEPDFTHKITIEGNVLYGAPDDSYYGSAGRNAWSAFEQAIEAAAAGLEQTPGKLGRVERRPF